MLYALSWFFVFSLFALWSLAAWAVHAVAVWTVSNAGALTGVASDVEGLRLPEWLVPWVPPEIAQAMTSLLSGFAPVVESLLQTAPALASCWAQGCICSSRCGSGAVAAPVLGRFDRW